MFSSLVDYGTGGALLQLIPVGDGVRAEEVYFSREMRNYYSSSVLIDGYLYGYSSRVLTAMNFKTGEVAWKDRSVGKGHVITAEGKLYLWSEDGVAGLAEATPSGYREISRFSVPHGDLHTWTLPVIANGRLYLRGSRYAFLLRHSPALGASAYRPLVRAREPGAIPLFQSILWAAQS